MKTKEIANMKSDRQYIDSMNMNRSKGTRIGDGASVDFVFQKGQLMPISRYKNFGTIRDAKTGKPRLETFPPVSSAEVSRGDDIIIELKLLYK